MLPLYNTKSGAFREIIISWATSGGRREIELNSGSLPPIPGVLATLVSANGDNGTVAQAFVDSVLDPTSNAQLRHLSGGDTNHFAWQYRKVYTYF